MSPNNVVTDDPVGFEPVEVQGFRKIINHFRGISVIYPNLTKKYLKMSTCNQLETLEYRSIMPKNPPRHCFANLVQISVSTYTNVIRVWIKKLLI